MNDLDELWKIKSVNEAQSIQNIKVKAILSSGDNEKKQTSSYISNNSGVDKSLYSSLGASNNEVSSHFVTKNENKLITSITQTSEQKKKYEDLCKKFVDVKQKIVIVLF